eukprot:CAMPEP_0201909410 /NCGR_PEP_ID=MMETSP0903-20130614/1190_1 /ASSEMBLY_ACC=CAM_ASM_000552 /TAXON_ID=420261 /ORGANISM="Thalassiosira antarctica, Strain CCMP982" /LENGTH=1299 /DNA_ID=CAMNT_0048443935 /DNA_START=27 /DNA_END=3926 /DNA_ORIENTATION=+
MAATPLPPSTIGTIGALYTPQSAASSSNNNDRPQPRTSPIAHFSSLPNDGIGNDTLLLQSSSSNEGGIPTSGRLLAVNSHYIAYAVKKGLVRVIDRRSAAKTLLRGHEDSTRMVDAAFFGESSGKEGAGGLWDELALLKRQQSGNDVGMNGGGINGGNVVNSKAPLPPAAASDVLATLGGHGDTASILIWRIHSSNTQTLGADKLLEVRFGQASRLVWHPFNPNRFLLLSRNLCGSGADDGGGGRTVATLVETTRLVTHAHETEGHMVCDCKERDPGTGVVPGMIPLKVGLSGNDLSLAGANDITWSSKDARHVLTAHDDGQVRLWDLTATKATEGGGDLSSSLSIPCLAQLNVVSASSGPLSKVTRVLFLSQYEDSTNNSSNAITPPFITGTDMNHTITLWSSFPSNGSSIGVPQRLRVFGLRNEHTPISNLSLSSMLSVELIPAPYRPEPDSSALPSMDSTPADVAAWLTTGAATNSAAAVTVPSSFVLLAERSSGVMHALHLDTEWKETRYHDDGGGDEASNEVTVAVKGFDYVTTLNVVHPIYSYSVAPSSIEGDVGGAIGGNQASLKEERDVDLCCIQSKAVQMLTLSAEMCAPPHDAMGMMGGDLAPGVTLLNLDLPVEVSDDEEAEEEAEEELFEEELFEEVFEEEYDMEEDDLGEVEYSTNDSGDDDEEEEEEDVEVPTVTESEPDAFSNWLGAIANPLPPPTAVAATTKATAPPPPGLGFTSILPPPPGMAPSSAPAVAAAPAPPPPAITSSMTFLSPMQMLSGSGSDIEPPKKEETVKSVKSPSPVPMPVQAPAVRPASAPRPPGMPAASNKAAKKAAKKKGQDKKQAPANGPMGPMKILQREEPKEEPRGSILPPHIETPPTVAPIVAAIEAAVTANAAPTSSAADPTESTATAPSTMDITSIETAMEQIITAHMKSHEASIRKVIATEIASTVASTVGLAVGTAVRSSFKDANKQDQKAAEARQSKSIEAAVQRGVSAGLASGLASGMEEGLHQGLGKALAVDGDGKQQGKLGKALERHAKESAERAAKEAVGGMQPVIMNSLHQTMREVMVPAYESATRQMFQQTSSSLEQGLAQMSLAQANNNTNATSSLAPTLQAMSAQMMKMSEAIQSLSTEVAQLRGAVNTAGAANQNANAQQPTGPPQPLGIRQEITSLCQSHRYEEAFTKAVSASDGDLVLFACKNSDAEAVFNSNGEGAVSISQPILICLMQQLGAVLVTTGDTGEMKEILNWLQEIAVTIDPTNINIQRHVGSVVQQLQANINSKMSNCDPAFRRPLQTLMQVIRGLL